MRTIREQSPKFSFAIFLEQSFTRGGLILFQQLAGPSGELHRNNSPAPNRLPQYPEQGFFLRLSRRWCRSVCMTKMMLRDEAEKCRLHALSYLGKREASFLLRVAKEFDHLASTATE